MNLDLDLVSAWTLAFFGACAAGGVVGFLFNKLVGFELGLGVGLLIPGIVSLHFTWTFATGYLDFRDNPSRADGRVVSVEDRPANESGDITTPFAIVEFATRRAVQSSRPTFVAYIVIFAGIVGAGFWPGTVLEELLFAFGAMSLGLWIYVVDGVWRRRDQQWTLGVSVLAINFSAWVLALWLLSGRESQW